MKVLTVLMLGAGLACAQYVPHRYIVELEGSPAAALHRGGKRASIVTSARAVRDRQQAVARATQAQGARVLHQVDTVLNALIVDIPDDRAAALSSIPGVRRVHPARTFKLHLDHALPLVRVPDAWNALGGMSNAGTGIKIAIIDTGVDVHHPAFVDTDFTMPSGFPLTTYPEDVIYTSKKVIVARVYDNASYPDDVQGHGDAVAMAAAGETNKGPLGPITGVAPKAWIGNYKVYADGSDGSTSDDLIIPAIDDAVKDGMDVINLSLGGSLTEYMSADPLVAAVDAANAAGAVVVVSVGNDGPDPNIISSPANSPNVIGVCNTLTDRTFGVPLTLDDGQVFASLPNANVASSTDPVTAPVLDITAVDASGLACSTLPTNSLTGKIALIYRGSCNFSKKLDDAKAAGAVGAIIYSQPDNSIGPWNPEQATLPAVLVDNAAGLKIKAALAANAATQATLEFKVRSIAADPNGLDDSSSRGPAAEGQLKPDVCATGSEVITAWSPGVDGSAGYADVGGTSLSAPLVTGTAALVKQARPGLSTAQYRSLIVNTATPISLRGDTTKPLSVYEQGTGLLNAAAAVNSTLTAQPPSLAYGFGGAIIDKTLTVKLTNIGTSTDTYSLTVAPYLSGPAPQLSATSITLDPGAAREIQVAFTSKSLDPMAYQGFVVATGTNGIPVRIPYLYSVNTGAPRYVPVIYNPETGTPGSTQYVVFRIVDAYGTPVLPASAPQFSVVSGTGRILDWGSVDDTYPNAWAMQVRLGRVPGADNVFQIQVGDVVKQVTITAN